MTVLTVKIKYKFKDEASYQISAGSNKNIKKSNVAEVNKKWGESKKSESFSQKIFLL